MRDLYQQLITTARSVSKDLNEIEERKGMCIKIIAMTNIISHINEKVLVLYKFLDCRKTDEGSSNPFLT